MSKTKLEKLITDTDVALMESEVSNYHLRIFRQVIKQLKRYAAGNKVTKFSFDFGLEFLETLSRHYEKTTVCQNMRTVRFYLKYC